MPAQFIATSGTLPAGTESAAIIKVKIGTAAIESPNHSGISMRKRTKNAKTAPATKPVNIKREKNAAARFHDFRGASADFTVLLLMNWRSIFFSDLRCDVIPEWVHPSVEFIFWKNALDCADGFSAKTGLENNSTTAASIISRSGKGCFKLLVIIGLCLFSCLMK